MASLNKNAQLSKADVEISNFKKNCMGTSDFDGKFHGMRKTQSFIVYPISNEMDSLEIMIQSDTRIGTINTDTGEVRLSPTRSGRSYNYHLYFISSAGTLNAEQLFTLKAAVMATASAKAGTTNVIHCDNSGALNVFK